MRHGRYFSFMKESIGEEVDPRSIARNLDEIEQRAKACYGADEALDQIFTNVFQEARRLLGPHLKFDQDSLQLACPGGITQSSTGYRTEARRPDAGRHGLCGHLTRHA